MKIEFYVICDDLPYVILSQFVIDELDKIARENGFKLVNISLISRNDNRDKYTYQIKLTDSVLYFDQVYELRGACVMFRSKASDFLKECGTIQNTSEKL